MPLREENKEKIVIEAGPGMGDLVLLTPVLKRLKELKPEVQLSVLSGKGNLFLVDRLPYVDEVLPLKQGKFLARWRAGFKLNGADTVIFTTWQPQLATVGKLIGVKNIIGVCKKQSYRRFFNKELMDTEAFLHRFRAEILTQMVGEALDIDLTNDGICEISAPSEDELMCMNDMLEKEGIKRGEKFAVIAPFGKTSQNLPLKLVADIISFFSANGLPAVILSDEKKTLPKELFSDFKVVDLSARTDKRGMIALLKLATIAVTTDSGPMHISCALKTPTVSVFSTDLPERYAPRKYCYPVQAATPCDNRPCSRKEQEACMHKRCINDITGESVILQIKRAVEEIPLSILN